MLTFRIDISFHVQFNAIKIKIIFYYSKYIAAYGIGIALDTLLCL